MATCTAMSANEFRNKKAGLLEEMLQIAKTQMESITQDRPDELLKALQRRERIMGRIDSLDTAFKISGGNLSGQCGENTEIKSIAASILAIDQQCAQKASQRMAVYKADLKSIAQSAKQLGAYANPYASSQGIYFDTRK